ncbi:MAG TPA: hypothetical protein VES88_03515 [Gemmatimonadaceae bacterium]|nr:hypothetical protein [Gemmatimonadaceae bacterium]
MKRVLPFSVLAVLISLLLMRLAGTTSGQQLGDPNFDARVARAAYTKKRPRVLFDEAHNNFHTSGGRYKPFVDLITNDGYQVTANKEKFSTGSLKGYDILVIANAQDVSRGDVAAFTEGECDAVRDWVKGGGSLLLIADHQPWGAAASNLAGRFGVEMRSVFTIDPSTHDPEMVRLFGETGQGYLMFTRENGLLTDHPVTRGRNAGERVNRVMTFVGQSLTWPGGGLAFLKLAGTALDVQRSGERVSAAGRAQGVALRFGKGRVTVLGEAGMLSAQVVGREQVKFGMNRPGIDNRR